MASVTRFPHYHQAENVVTNHVMVMLRMLYSTSPKLLEALLQALCADEVTVGPRFSQQVAGTHSVSCIPSFRFGDVYRRSIEQAGLNLP